jgi:transmembrane sensor
MRSLQIPAFATGRHRALATSPRPPRPLWQWGAIAAAVVIAAGGMLRSTVMRRAHPATVAGAVLPGGDVTTHAGQQAAFLLPDGSRVMLAPGSRLHVPATFDVATSFGRRRDVTLSGRASFTVVHDPARPFLVHTATAMTEDVGTTFQVTAYPEAPGTQVVVVEGSVALWDGTRSGHEDGARGKPLMLLVRGDMATLDTAGTAILTRNVSLDALTAWTRGDLVLDHTPLREAIPELDRWFNVDIQLADSTVGARRVKAVIHQASAGDALTRLAMVLDLDIARRGRVVVLAPRNPERRE